MGESVLGLGDARIVSRGNAEERCHAHAESVYGSGETAKNEKMSGNI